jgi:hypothetical protein
MTARYWGGMCMILFEDRTSVDREVFDISNSWDTALLFSVGIGVILIGLGYKAGSPEKIII